MFFGNQHIQPYENADHEKSKALKEKENIVAHVRSFTFDKYCTANNLSFNYPCRPVRMSQQDWLNSLNIKERNEYLHLQDSLRKNLLPKEFLEYLCRKF